MGLLGLNPSVHDIYATDGSLAVGQMRAGVYIVKSGMALRCRVGRRSESRTSLRLETGASYLSLEHGKDVGAPIFVLTDPGNHLSEIDDRAWQVPDSSLLQGWRHCPGDTVTSPGQSGFSYFLRESTSSKYQRVQSFFASQTLHNIKKFKKKIRRCK